MAANAPSHHLTTSTGREEVDPELLELPDPPKRERTMTVAVLMLTAIASLAMVVSLRRDAAYAFTEASPRDVGELGAPGAALAFSDNGYVRGHGMLGAGRAIRYERPLVSGSFRLMPVVVPSGSHPTVWVEVAVPPGAENARWVPPSEVSGRLVRFETAGPKHRGLAAAVRDATGQDVPSGAWLLVDGDAPANAKSALLLVVMFLGFAIWNVLATVKLLRKVR